MDNFKKPRKKKLAESIDGFLPSTGDLNDTHGEPIGARKKFESSYTPDKKTKLISKKRDLSRIAAHSEDHTEDKFIERNASIGEGPSIDQPDQIDLSLPEEVYRPAGLLGKKSNKKNKSVRRRVVRTVAVLFVSFTVALSALFAYGYIKGRQIFRGNGEGAAALDENVDPARLNGEGDGRINILLLGKGGAGHTAPDLTDTILVASIDPIQKEAALLSVPRDMYVRNEKGYSSKINAVYADAKQSAYASGGSDDVAEDAGLSAIKNNVSNVAGIPIHYYVMVNFQAFEDAIDIVGGLDIYIKEPLYDYTIAWLLGGDPLIADKGQQVLDGKRALLYARSRHGSARGDFDRTERQREIIVALQQEILSTATLANPLKLVDLLGAFGDNVRTDLNGVGEIKRLFEIGQGITPDKIVSVGLADDPILVSTDFVDNQSIVRPIAGLYQYDEIHKFVRNKLRDPFLRDEDSRVVVLNGSEVAGLATTKKNELESYGYNVVEVDNAPTQDYIQSLLISLSPQNNRYTESYLTRRLGLDAMNSTDIVGLPTNETADFVIILGDDEAIKTTTE